MNEWSDAERRVERAHELYESGRWEDALRELRAALKVNPYQGEWHFNVGLTLDALGRHDEAIDSFKRALTYQGEEITTLNYLGLDCLRTERLDDAIKHFERAGELAPDDSASFCNRIEAYAAMGDHDQAELMFYLALQLDDTEARAYLNIAVSLLDRNNIERAIWCLSHARRLDPKDPDIYARLGEAYWMKGSLDRAHRYFLRQLRLDPADVDALMDLGRLLMDMQRPGDAAERFRQVTELEPTHAEAHFELGQLALDIGQLDSAQTAFELVRRLDPAMPVVQQRLAGLAVRRGRHEEARRLLRAELALDGTGVMRQEQDLRELAHLLLDAQMPAESAVILDQLAEEYPEEARLWHQLGVALLMSGNLECGVRACRQAVRQDENYTLAMHNLVLAHMEMGQRRRAKYWLGRALALQPSDTRLRKLQTRLWWKAVTQFVPRWLRRK